MADWEKQADFEPGGETLDGASTTRRPDAISLDYLRAFTLGPVALQDPSEGVFDYVWYARVDNAAGEVYVARENDAGTGWKAESLLFTFSGADILECDFAFDQNGNSVFVAERATGAGGDPELWIRFFDPTIPGQDFSSYGEGRTPRALLDAPRQPQRSDLLVFYFNDASDALEYRVQGDRYQTANATGLTGVASLSVEDLAKAVDSRLQVIYSDRNASDGTYSLDRLVSVLYPILAETEAFRPTHLFLAATINQVVQRFTSQDVEAYRPTHEILAATLNDIARRLTDQDVEAFRPDHKIIGATLNDLALRHTTQPVEAYRPTHEIIAATLAEVIIRVESQPVEAFRPTHEVGAAFLTTPLPVTTGLRAHYRADSVEVTAFDGQSQSSWPDESPNGFDLSSAAGSPSWHAEVVNGHPVLRFDGTEMLYSAAHGVLAGTDNFTMYIVYKVSSTITEGIFNVGDVATTGGIANFSPEVGLRVVGGNRIWDNPQVGAFELVVVRFEGSDVAGAPGAECWINGTQRSVSSEGSQTVNWQDGIALGGRLNNGTPEFKVAGDVAEAAIYGAAHSTSDRQSLESHLTAKYGL